MVALVSEHVGLRRVGRRYQGLCPFHAEKTASFSVNPELGLYHCFGCGAGGDAIQFVREVEHLDFATAVERLAAKAGVTLRYDDAAVTRDRQRRDRLVEAMAAAVAFYHRILLDDPGAGVARKYLRSRGFDGAVARSFSLGWSPDRYDADDAGQNAALRIYQWESSYEIRLSVADLPSGQDPADVGLADPPRLAAAVGRARPFLAFRLERLLGAADLASVEGRAVAAKAAVAIVAEHPDDLVRDQYLMQLADRVGIDVDRLRRASADAKPGSAGGFPRGRDGDRVDRGGRRGGQNGRDSASGSEGR